MTLESSLNYSVVGDIQLIGLPLHNYVCRQSLPNYILLYAKFTSYATYLYNLVVLRENRHVKYY